MAITKTTRYKGDGRGRIGGGRKAGTPNKITVSVREALTPTITKYMSGEGIGDAKYTFERDLAEMKPEDRAKVVASVINFIAPKMTSVEVKEQVAAKTFADELEELDI